MDHYYKWALKGVFSLLRSYKRHEANKRKIGQERSSKQQAHSMNARKGLHAQMPYPNQAFTHESSKVGGNETEKTEARRLMERRAAQQNKNTSEER